MIISLKNINLNVGDEVYLKNISLEFEAGLKNIFLGRTLAGKTSLLRPPAGLMCQLFFQSDKIFFRVLNE